MPIINARTTSRIMAMDLKEFARIAYRDPIQHGTDRRPINFMKAPIRDLSREIQAEVLAKFPAQDVPGQLLQFVRDRYGLEKISDPVLEYKGRTPEALLERDLRRSSDMPTRMVAITGSTGRLSNEMYDQCYAFGRRLAKSGMVPIVTDTNGVTEPVLEGVRSAHGLSVGLLAEKDTKIADGRIRDVSDLVALPIVHSDTEPTLRSTIAAMSGRALVMINSNQPLTMRVRSAMTAAYNAIPTILVNTKLPEVARHPLQVSSTLDNLFATLCTFIDPARPEEPNNFDYLLDGSRYPVSVFAGTKYDQYQASAEYTARVAALLSGHGFFTVTGAGPGAMETVAQAAQPKSLTLGLNFFPTYLSSNPYVDIPIVSNLKMERSDMMTLSSIAAINLGGSHATFDEMASARRMGRPIINCVPRQFPADWFMGISSYRGDAPIYEEEDPAGVLGILKGIVS